MADDKKLDQLLREALSAPGKGAGPAGTACPGAQDLAAYLEGALEPDRRQDLERHLAACPACRRALAAARAAELEPGGPAPRQWLEEAQALISPAPRVQGSRAGLGLAQRLRRWLSWPRLLPVGAAVVTVGLTIMVLRSLPPSLQENTPRPEPAMVMKSAPPPREAAPSPQPAPPPVAAAPAPLKRLAPARPAPRAKALPRRAPAHPAPKPAARPPARYLLSAPPPKQAARAPALDLLAVKVRGDYDRSLVASRLRRLLPALASCYGRGGAGPAGGRLVVRLSLDQRGRASLAGSPGGDALGRCLLRLWPELGLPRPPGPVGLTLTFRLP